MFEWPSRGGPAPSVHTEEYISFVSALSVYWPVKDHGTFQPLFCVPRTMLRQEVPKRGQEFPTYAELHKMLYGSLTGEQHRHNALPKSLGLPYVYTMNGSRKKCPRLHRHFMQSADQVQEQRTQLAHVPAQRLPLSSKQMTPTVSCDSPRSEYAPATASCRCCRFQPSNALRASSVRVSAAPIPFPRAKVVAPFEQPIQHHVIEKVGSRSF